VTFSKKTLVPSTKRIEDAGVESENQSAQAHPKESHLPSKQWIIGDEI
jgi:hypothetical protein